MNWTDLAGPLAKVGGSLLGGLVAGPAGAAIGGRIGGALSDALGVPATPEAIANTIDRDPAAAGVAVRQVEAQYGPELVAYAHAQLAFAAGLARDEKAEGWTGYGWRRLAGWSVPVLGLWQLLVGPLVAALTGQPVTADFSAFVAYAGIVTTFLMGGHTLKEVMGRK
ncbi:hypothetical protein [Blastochloris viridis]|uniref:Holin of 3TMs, for gene-transfer release n=1 Tax=Blastochloris viridis TaxID=1079 RepID=A0A0H5BCM2_BLAVI|nr:hypothetical protein [Blastochloris viridis]ALK10110.1 hypothetical protein BVIR_2343 [Blastochloris viridis]BAR99962.1 hypothetical protein BV133_2369 [Blastochloris viridis]CUU42774.1 hypothetical protein BVIRIDIS_17890 [Blastochloris viridis]